MKHICPKCGGTMTGSKCWTCNPGAVAPDRTYADTRHLAAAYASCDALHLTTTEQLRVRIRVQLAAERNPSKAWAHKLIDKHTMGEHVPLLSLQFARTALHQVEPVEQVERVEQLEPREMEEGFVEF